MRSSSRSKPLPAMRIGELARRTKLTVETLRFYERAGLLGAVTRDASGYRVYDEQAYRTLVTIRWAQDLGLRIEDLAAFLAGEASEPRKRIADLRRTVDERLRALHDEVARVKLTIASLEALRATPFAGDCMLPAAFVDELVKKHEARAGQKAADRQGAAARKKS